jgi:hypothetical protein
MAQPSARWRLRHNTENVQAATLEAFVHEAVSNKVSLLATDKWVGYKYLGKEYPHRVVDHAKANT